MCLLSYSGCCPQQRQAPSAFVLSSPRIQSPTDLVSRGRLGPLHLRLASSCRPPTRGGSRSRDCVFTALGAHAVHTSLVNNCPFSHRLFRISDETAEMSVWHVSHQSECGSATPLYSSPTAIIFKGEKPSLSLVTPFL